MKFDEITNQPAWETELMKAQPNYTNEERAEIAEERRRRIIKLEDNVRAQKNAPDGVYATTFDADGYWHWTEAVTFPYNTWEEYRFRIRAASRRIA